jgi:hypothetical protein
MLRIRALLSPELLASATPTGSSQPGTGTDITCGSSAIRITTGIFSTWQQAGFATWFNDVDAILNHHWAPADSIPGLPLLRTGRG